MKVPYTDLGAQWNDIRERAMPAIDQVLSSGLYLEHPTVATFEARVAQFLGVNHVVSLNSGTDALLLALVALGISCGDEIITVPNSFIASVATIEHVGAKSIFIDVGPDHLMNIGLVEAAITGRTRAIMPVHLEGKMVDMVAINTIAKKHGLLVIEDAAQSFGSTFGGFYPGQLSDAACFSLHPLKNLNAAGDGGLVATNRSETAEKIVALRNHGQSARNVSTEFGFVSRLDALQAAILHLKLDDLAITIARRKELARIYDSNLPLTKVKIPTTASEANHTYHLYVIEVENRDYVKKQLQKHDIGTKIHYPKLITEQPAFLNKYPNYISNHPEATRQSGLILSLPIHQHLSIEQIEYVSQTLTEIENVI
jgi:dTDP-4-amino-4,6-dideoxygalactose transaminase